MSGWQNRIVGHESMLVSELLPNPKNWRKHPRAQAGALSGALTEVGLVAGPIWNKRTGRLVDGHLRVELARKAGEEKLPVTIVDLSEEEEAIVLASFDPIGAMAIGDGARLNKLIDEIHVKGAELDSFLDEERIKEEGFWGIGDQSKQKRGDIALSLRVMCSDTNTIEAAIEAALMAGAVTRGAALVEICRGYLEKRQ